MRDFCPLEQEGFLTMKSTMQDRPLTITEIMRHGATVYGASEVVTFQGKSSRRATFAEVELRARKLAQALERSCIPSIFGSSPNNSGTSSNMPRMRSSWWMTRWCHFWPRSSGT